MRGNRPDSRLTCRRTVAPFQDDRRSDAAGDEPREDLRRFSSVSLAFRRCRHSDPQIRRTVHVSVAARPPQSLHVRYLHGPAHVDRRPGETRIVALAWRATEESLLAMKSA
jgi:hypothetical protein